MPSRPAFIEWLPSATQVPVVVSIPHSALYVPDAIAQSFTAEQAAWMRNTDWFLAELYSFLPACGVTTIVATHSRYVADLNRDPSVQLFGPFWPAVVVEHNYHGAPVYRHQPDIQELEERIATVHAPYHRKLSATLAEVKEQFGRVLLLDLHSFMGPTDRDICLGNLNGLSSTPATLSGFASCFAAEQFSVACNDPWPGAFILSRHHRSPDIEALQIELRYTNYMDCASIDEPPMPLIDHDRIAQAQPRLRRAIIAAIEGYLHDEQRF